MESRNRRKRIQGTKWLCYGGLLILCAALQTMPGLLQFGRGKPAFILPLCVAVTLFEGEFAGAIFSMIGGLLWDYIGGRTVGMMALLLMFLCFGLSVVVRLYLKLKFPIVVLLNGLTALSVFSVDYLFFYWMQGYTNRTERYLLYVLPTTLLTTLVSIPLFYLVQRIWKTADEKMKNL